MKSIMSQPSLEELEAFWADLQGPLGAALRETGAIMDRRLRERSVGWDDLSDEEIAEFFVSAFAEAAPHAYPQVERSKVEQAISVMGQEIRMLITATAIGSNSLN